MLRSLQGVKKACLRGGVSLSQRFCSSNKAKYMLVPVNEGFTTEEVYQCLEWIQLAEDGPEVFGENYPYADLSGKVRNFIDNIYIETNRKGKGKGKGVRTQFFEWNDASNGSNIECIDKESDIEFYWTNPRRGDITEITDQDSEKHPSQAIGKLINSARKSIDIGIGYFDDTTVAMQLKQAQKKNSLTIRVLTSQDCLLTAKRQDLMDKLTNIPQCHVHVGYGTLNCGVFDWNNIIVDNKRVLHGSYNFTINAKHSCWQNAILVESPCHAANVAKVFNYIWDHPTTAKVAYRYDPDLQKSRAIIIPK